MTARFSIEVPAAMPASILSINGRLYFLALPISILPTQVDKRREFMNDLVVGIGQPILEMVLGLS